MPWRTRRSATGARFRDELLWQEYARHLYARVGAASGAALRREQPIPGEPVGGRAVAGADALRRAHGGRTARRRLAGQPDQDVAGLPMERARRCGLA